MNRLLKWIKPILLFCFLLAGTNSCKDDFTSVIPYTYINMNINPANYIDLNIPAGTAYFENVGFGGVLIVNNWGDSTTPYLSFDAACTNEAPATISVVQVKENGTGIATCPTCGSQFMIFGGSGAPIKGPAVQPLRQYNTITSSGRIIVRN